MKEHEAREAVASLWRNNPSGASTFHECSVDGCPDGARDELCDTHIIEFYQGNRRHLAEVLYTIKKYREAVSDLIDAEYEREE